MYASPSALEEEFMTARFVANKIQLADQAVTIYASPKVSHALEVVTQDMTLYEGVKLVQLMQAIYQQGKKDGARAAFEMLDTKLLEAEKAIPHKNPGKPKRTKK
jgi:hypothetical protein